MMNVDKKSQKVAEIVSVLRIYFEKTSPHHTLKNNEIKSIAKNEYGVEIEKRRLSDIINAIEDISKNSPKLLPFKVNTSGNKFFREGFILSDDDIDLIIQTLNESSLISDDENDDLQKHLKALQSFGHQSYAQKSRKASNPRIKEFRSLKNLAKKKDASNNGARFFTFDYDTITDDELFVYPNIPLKKGMGLNGFVIDIINCEDGEARICLFGNLRTDKRICQEYSVLIILPVSKIKIEPNTEKDDWSLDDMKYDLCFTYGNTMHYKNAVEAIEKYKQGDDSVVFNFEIKYRNCDIDIIESHDKIVKVALKKFYPSQYDKLKFIPHPDNTIHVKFNSTIARFYKFYCSNIKLLGIIGVVSPDFVASILVYYSEKMSEGNTRQKSK